MELTKYQELTSTTSTYPEQDNLLYPILGAYGELGEVLAGPFKEKTDFSPAIAHFLSGLVSVSEACEIVKKAFRDNKGYIPADKIVRLTNLLDRAAEGFDISAIKFSDGDLTNGRVMCKLPAVVESKELGDILWYAAAIGTAGKLDLGTVAEENISKLTSRKERGVISGSGNDR